MQMLEEMTLSTNQYLEEKLLVCYLSVSSPFQFGSYFLICIMLWLSMLELIMFFTQSHTHTQTLQEKQYRGTMTIIWERIKT